MQKTNAEKPLDRYLSRLDVWALAFGCMVGWGVFAMPGNTFLPVAGPLGTLLSLSLGMVIMLVIGNNFSYLMGRSAITGGVYSYTKEAFGRDHAFLSSWFLCLSYLTIVFLNGTALFYVIRILLGDTISGSLHYTIAGNDIFLAETVLSVIVLVVAGVLAVVAKPQLQHLFTVLSLILFLGTAIVAGVCMPAAVKGGALRDFGFAGITPARSVFSIIILAPWAFVGFEVTSFDTAHFGFSMSTRSFRRIIFLAILCTAFAYISMTLISVAYVPEGFDSWQFYVASLDGLSGLETVPTFFATKSAMGTVGVVLMTVTAVAAILTGIIGGYRATTRVLSTMAEDRILSDKFSKTAYSILFIMLISILLAFLGRNTLNWFVDLTSFGAIVGFGYTSAAAWKIARIERKKGTVITGAIGTVISAIFVVFQLIPNLSSLEAMGSEAYLLLAFWCLLGLIFYWRTIQHSNMADYSGLSTSGIVLFTLLIYAALMWLGKRLLEQSNTENIAHMLSTGAAIVFPLIFVGMAIMQYVQNLIRKKHEASEREKIHAVESSLAKSQFLFNMSHDIRTPMNAIIGYTNLALKEPSSPEVHTYLEKIARSNQQLLALINDILEMSRIENGKVELELAPADLREIYEGIYDLFSEQMKQKEMDFHIHTSQIHHRFVWCDRKNLNRVLLNVLGNAYKFTPAGGTISASLWEIGGAKDGYGSYEMRIKDSGIGMSKEFAERVFNAFERERTSTVSGIEGTGLGMSITKSLVDLMGGTIEVLTAPGSGTEIIIRLKFRLADEKDLPQTASAEQTQEKTDDPGQEKPSESNDFSGRNVLLVEDNPINMEIANMILTQVGFTVDMAENGKIALDKVEASEHGQYDLILMDIQMNVMDGYEATRAIRALADREKASIPILAMTANAFQEDVQAAKDAGMQGHIAKPIDVGVMLRTIGEVLNGR